MKTCTVSEAKSKLGELADSAIKGKPTIIIRGGKLVILQAYALPDHPDEFDALIQAGKDSPHRLLTPKVLDEIWKPVGEAHNDLSDDSHLDDINDLLAG